MKKVTQYVAKELHSAGVPNELIPELLAHGVRPCLSWTLHRFVNDILNVQIIEALESFHTALGNELTFGQIKYAFYSTTIVKLKVVRKRPEYCLILQTIKKIHPNMDEFWNGITPFCYDDVLRIVVRDLSRQGESAVDISVRCNVSRSMVYKLRNYDIKCIGKTF